MRNKISNIQEIEVINAFRNAITDMTTVERIAIKKPKTMAELLT